MATLDKEAKEYWDNRYKTGGTSGYGSYGEQLSLKLKWLSNLHIKSISEIGCGDFNFGSNLLRMYPNATYFGTDISETIIETNKKKYPKHTFKLDSEIPAADLVLCIDVLLHVLKEEEVERLLQQLESKWVKYLAITAYERDQPFNAHVRIRKFDYKSFGEPIIREVVEENGQMYFYLFKKPTIDLKKVSCVLNTKENTYPKPILDDISRFPFGEILILTGSDSPYRKYELFYKVKHNFIYYQDDDCIAPIMQLTQMSKSNMINVAMKRHHFEVYKPLRMTMGFGWGAIFPSSILRALDKYKSKYGKDFLFKRDTEKILTELVYPQNRLILPITDLPTAMMKDRISFEPKHYQYMKEIQKRCKTLLDLPF